MRVVIAAGGTAGHVVPALAVADALRADGAEVHFVGGERAERTLVPAAGYPLETLRVEGLARRDPVRAARAVAKAAAAVLGAVRLLRRLRPDAVMGGGGYVAGPVGLAAILLRIPLVLTEADSHLGLTNRLLAPLARRVCLAFAIPGRSGDRYRVTGRPVPPPDAPREPARAALGIGRDEVCVLVFGGSLGARSINEAAVQAFREAPFHVLDVCGERDHAELAAELGDPPPAHYDLRPYVSPFGPALAASDLVIARAGGRSSRSAPTAARRCWCPTRTRRPTTRRPTRAGWPMRARRWSSATPSSPPSASARGRRPARRPAAPGRHGPGLRRAGAPERGCGGGRGAAPRRGGLTTFHGPAS